MKEKTSTARKTRASRKSVVGTVKSAARKVAEKMNIVAPEPPAPKVATIPVVITCYSQPHVLQQRMKEENLKHGDRVNATLSRVRLESNFGKMVLYFCPMDCITNIALITAGDGGSLPAEATVEGLQMPGNLKPGLYDLKNVELFSNGTMQVIATQNTEFEPVNM